MTWTDISCVALSPLLWIGYGTMGESAVGALMGFGAMFATVYAVLSVVWWLGWRD